MPGRIDSELRHKVDRAGLALVRSVSGLAEDLPSGVRLLDRWCSGGHGGVLFWVDRELDLWGFGREHAVLHLVRVRQVDGEWRTDGGGGFGIFSGAEYIARDGVGLHRLGGSSGGQVQLTIAVASPEVCSIELRGEQGVSLRSPGADGFCLLGLTDSDPVTYARPLASNGDPLGADLQLLSPGPGWD